MSARQMYWRRWTIKYSQRIRKRQKVKLCLWIEWINRIALTVALNRNMCYLWTVAYLYTCIMTRSPDDSGWSSLFQCVQGNSQIIFPFNELNVFCYGMNGLPGTIGYIYEHTATPFHGLSLSFPASMSDCASVYAFVCDVCVCDCIRSVALTKTAVLWFCFGNENETQWKRKE